MSLMVPMGWYMYILGGLYRMVQVCPKWAPSDGLGVSQVGPMGWSKWAPWDDPVVSLVGLMGWFGWVPQDDPDVSQVGSTGWSRFVPPGSKPMGWSGWAPQGGPGASLVDPTGWSGCILGGPYHPCCSPQLLSDCSQATWFIIGFWILLLDMMEVTSRPSISNIFIVLLWKLLFLLSSPLKPFPHDGLL